MGIICVFSQRLFKPPFVTNRLQVFDSSLLVGVTKRAVECVVQNVAERQQPFQLALLVNDD